MFGNVGLHKERDKQRRVACCYHSITYFEIPYWWQRDKESLITIIHQVRPDIAPRVTGTPFHFQLKTKVSKEVNVMQCL